jgi:predicted transcriptional regulator
MTNMTSSPFSVRLDDGLRAELQAEAKRLDRPASYLASKAIAYYLAERKREREILLERLKEADKGVFVSSEKVGEWVDSWFTENELPMPEPDVFPDRH